MTAASENAEYGPTTIGRSCHAGAWHNDPAAWDIITKVIEPALASPTLASEKEGGKAALDAEELRQLIARAICCPDGCMQERNPDWSGKDCYTDRDTYKFSNVGKSTKLIMDALAPASLIAKGEGK